MSFFMTLLLRFCRSVRPIDHGSIDVLSVHLKCALVKTQSCAPIEVVCSEIFLPPGGAALCRTAPFHAADACVRGRELPRVGPTGPLRRFIFSLMALAPAVSSIWNGFWRSGDAPEAPKPKLQLRLRLPCLRRCPRSRRRPAPSIPRPDRLADLADRRGIAMHQATRITDIRGRRQRSTP
jgi:hypothetical protein